MIIKRDYYLNKLIESIDEPLVKVITGIRRCGKSFLLFNLFYEYLIEVKKIKQDHIIKIELDRLSMKDLQNPDNLCKYVLDKIKDKDKYFVFIDEIQLCKEFVPVLNEFLHFDNLDVYVTGSNSRMLSKDIITEFRGRSEQIHLQPLSFREFYMGGKYKDFNIALDDFMIYGSLPYTLVLNNNQKKSEYLIELFIETYIKDIKERNKIRQIDLLQQIIDLIASNIGSYTNCINITNTIKSKTNISISHNTVKLFLQYLEDAFIIRKSLKYDVKGKKYLSCPYKYYFTDTGLRNACLNFRQLEKTHLIENIVFNELVNRGYSVDTGVLTINDLQDNKKYVRKQLECDFVVNKIDQRVYIQCAYTLESEGKLEQESKSLNLINDSFKKIIITFDNVKKWTNQNGIIIMSLKDFLLGEKISELDDESNYDWNSVQKLISKYK